MTMASDERREIHVVVFHQGLEMLVYATEPGAFEFLDKEADPTPASEALRDWLCRELSLGRLHELTLEVRDANGRKDLHIAGLDFNAEDLKPIEGAMLEIVIAPPARTRSARREKGSKK